MDLAIILGKLLETTQFCHDHIRIRSNPWIKITSTENKFNFS